MRISVIYGTLRVSCKRVVSVLSPLASNSCGGSHLSKKKKYDKNNLKAVFCLLERLVYIKLVTCTRLSCNAQFSYRFPFFTLSVKDLCKHAASKFFDEIDIFTEKMSSQNRPNYLILLDLLGIMHRQ